MPMKKKSDVWQHAIFSIGLVVIIAIITLFAMEAKSEYKFHSDVNMKTVDALVEHIKSRPYAVTVVSYESMGGQVRAMFYAVEDLEKHNVTGVVRGACYSACANMLVLSDNIKVSKHATILFHMPRVSNGLTTHVITLDDENPYYRVIAQVYVQFYDKYVDQYLTPKERTALLKGEDVIITGEEFQKRWDKIHNKGDKK